MRVLAIGNIHGCSRALNSLLASTSPTSSIDLSQILQAATGASSAGIAAIRAAHIAVCTSPIDYGDGPPPGTTIVAALIFRKDGLRVGTVVNGGIAHLVPVVIGEDDGANVQIVTGLGMQDRVIQDPPDSLIEGEKVQVVSPGSQANAGGK